MLDIKVCDAITKLLETLATSGKQSLDKKVFKEFVQLAGQSECYMQFSLERIFQHLEQKHSEVRLGAFLIVEELFRRSHYFREILLNDFHSFLELTVESNPEKPLPPPLSAAKTLKQSALQAIHKWYSKFREDHKRLALSYNFLKNNMKVDFQDALKRNETELKAIRLEQERQKRFLDKKIADINEQIDENQDEIMRVVTEMDNCFCLLIPKPDYTFGDSEQQSSINDEPEEINLREHGFQSSTTIQIDIKDSLQKVQETEDNATIIENLRDFNALLKNRFIIMIKKWVVIASKADDQPLFRKVMDLKNLVGNQIERFSLLKLCKSVKNKSESESESDSDFEEVPEKEGFEADVTSPPVATFSKNSSTFNKDIPGTSKRALESTGWRLWDVKEDDAKDPTTLSATLKSLYTKKDNPAKPSSSATRVPAEESILTMPETRKEKLMKVAPKLPFDVDLYHWEDKNLKAPSIEIVESPGHQFWTSSQDREGEVIDDPNGIASLRTRVIEFTGAFEAVKWSCRAPMPSGTLCPRRDRLKCPLHGKIIARDNMGNPSRQEDILELEHAKEVEAQSKPPEWQDPEFLKDIEAATGMDLTIKPPKKGKQKQKTFAELYPSLTDIDKRNTTKTRLAKKVFNKSAMKRVAESMDDLSSKRFQDKFGDQWNYSMNND